MASERIERGRLAVASLSEMLDENEEIFLVSFFLFFLFFLYFIHAANCKSYIAFLKDYNEKAS